MQMYFVAVVLPRELDEKVLHHKKWMAERYGCKVGLKSPAHITIVPPFWMEPEKEEQLKRDLLRISQSFTAFTISTDNFSAFRSRTLFVAVEENGQLQALRKAADEFFRHADYKMKIENRPFHPHITIATRDLHKKDFAECWPHFEAKEFREEFEARGLALLRHNGRAWDVVWVAGFDGSV